MTTHRWVKNSQGEYVPEAFPGVVPAAKPEAEVAPEWRYIPTVKYTELTEGMTLINQAGEKWVIKAIDKTGVPARWKYKLVNPATGYEWSRPFIEVERYLKSEAAIPKPKVTPEVTEYISPEGTIAQVIPVKSRTDPTKWALLSKAEGTTFGVPRSYAEVKLAADKENVRMAAYEKAVGIKREAKVTTPKVETKPTIKEPWEMTKAEYKNKRYSELMVRRGLSKEQNLETFGLSGEIHRSRVRQALSEGRPVPFEVLADYPDLQVKKR